MAENSKIEWTDHTFNPWVGCTKVSPACDHCYAESWAKRTGSPGLWQGQRRRTTEANWRKPIKWNAESERLGIRYKVFCCSLADVFDNAIDLEWRADLWRLIRATPNLDWLLLTKRIGNVEKMFPGGDYPNVWLGATVINQEEADRDGPKLQREMWPARLFFSIEPMLGKIDTYRGGFSLLHNLKSPQGKKYRAIDWVICGGESGPNARVPADFEDSARFLRDQCAEAGVAFFMKQMPKKTPIPADLMIRQFPVTP